MLVRIGRRKTSWESDNIEEVIEAEFRSGDLELMLSPSVYDVDDAERPRAHAEHQASADLNPFPCSHFNLAADHAEVKVTPGSGSFVFTKERHRELAFQSREHLHSYLEDLWNSERTSRILKTSKSSIGDYLRSAIESGDPEWREFLLKTAKKKDWMKLVGAVQK